MPTKLPYLLVEPFSRILIYLKAELLVVVCLLQKYPEPAPIAQFLPSTARVSIFRTLNAVWPDNTRLSYGVDHLPPTRWDTEITEVANGT